MLSTEEKIQEALLLLQDAHQQLLDAGHYGVDLLIFRAIQLLQQENSGSETQHRTNRHTTLSLGTGV